MRAICQKGGPFVKRCGPESPLCFFPRVICQKVGQNPHYTLLLTLDKRIEHRKALDRRRFVRDCPSPRPDQRRLVVCSPRSWSELRVSRSMELSIGCILRLRACSPTKGERSIFSFQTIVDFVLILLGHAVGLDHHAALLIFRTNVLKHAKIEGFFQQRKIRKTDTAREVCVRMAAKFAVMSSWLSVMERLFAEETWRSFFFHIANFPSSAVLRRFQEPNHSTTRASLHERLPLQSIQPADLISASEN